MEYEKAIKKDQVALYIPTRPQCRADEKDKLLDIKYKLSHLGDRKGLETINRDCGQ